MLIEKLANINDAYHPIRHAFTKQATQEAATLLLGSVSEVWREREIEAGDDTCSVCSHFILKERPFDHLNPEGTPFETILWVLCAPT